jgi:Zn-dependent M28 family amino/carboxypeptidase
MDPLRRPGRFGLLALTLVASCAGVPPASDEPPMAASGAPAAESPAASAATTPAVDRLRADLAALQAIADASDGIRATGTAGYDASVEHVADALRGAGLAVETPEVPYTGFRDLGGSLEVGGRTFAGPDELRALIYSPSGEVSGRVTLLEESGCQPSDFAGVGPGEIVLTTQGGCFRRDQAINAAAAGATALLVGYPGRGAGEIYRPTLIDPAGITIPVASVTDQAVELLSDPSVGAVTLRVSTDLPPSTFGNVVAQLGDGPRVVIVGAHLDSVFDGPGINDNGSGVAAVLEIARALAAEGAPDGWSVRFGLWGGEELGSIGSRAYAEDVGDEVEAYLNLDMAGSVNGTTLVYDETSAAPGSEAITAAFEAVLADRNEPSARADLGGSSDHFGFQQAGIPTGGLFAGASETGSAANPSAGGAGGPAPDPCYHIGCDDLDNVDLDRVALFADVTLQVMRELMASG